MRLGHDCYNTSGEECNLMYPKGQKRGYSELDLKSFSGEIGFPSTNSEAEQLLPHNTSGAGIGIPPSRGTELAARLVY